MIELPRWATRLNVLRPFADYTDLLELVAKHYRVYCDAENYLSPYNARQRGRDFYTPPQREDLKSMIKQGGVNDFSYSALLSSLIRFCETTKGNYALPTPHPSVIHSIQVPEPAFSLAPVMDKKLPYTHQLLLPGTEPIYLNGVRNPETIRFVIVRPKLSKLGTAAVKEWEALLFTHNHGYIPYWVDSNLNPRWSGKL